METVTKEQSGLAVVESQKRGLVAHAQPSNLLEAIALAASNPAMDMDRAERLFKMHQELVAQQAKAEFNGAMARAQAKILPVANNSKNDHTRSSYADLAAINAQIVPLYTAEGIAISFDTAECPVQGWFRTIARVSHAGGHTQDYHLDLPLDDVGAKGTTNKTGVQAMGSTNTYARRYLVRMIFNVSTEDDTDGNKPEAEAKPKISDEQKADWDSAIEATDDEDALRELGKTITAGCNAVKEKKKYSAKMAKLKEAK
jgi:hypothetical protein